MGHFNRRETYLRATNSINGCLKLNLDEEPLLVYDCEEHRNDFNTDS